MPSLIWKSVVCYEEVRGIYVFLNCWNSVLVLGHSRTVVGIEEKKNKSLCLLLFDPGCSSQEMQKLLKQNSDGTGLKLLRKFVGSLKEKQYQIVAVDGVLSLEEKAVSISEKLLFVTI